jgi:large subunit ribosomal protein L16
MLQPKRTKFRKYMKGRCGGKRSNLQSLAFGSFGVKALQSGRLSASVIEAVRRTVTRACKRRGKVWIRIFPDINVSSKPAEVRMGKGKGSPSYWMCRVQAGHILFELEGVPIEVAQEACRLGAHKVPLPTKFVTHDLGMHT